MEQATTTKRIHPLMAGAACSVILVSLLGVAAITGILPSSHGNAAPAGSQAAMTDTTNTQANLANPGNNLGNGGNSGVAMNSTMNPGANPTTSQTMYPSQPTANYANNNQIPYPAPVQHTQVAQASSHHQASHVIHNDGRSYPAQAPATQNSPVGIGVGAVIGGLLGSQVGNGNGRTLATIAGAVGGGYVGNEVAKRNP